MPTWLDWILRIAGGTVVLGALTLLAWGLFGDLARGRRRCPKCRYELGETGSLTCPECGRTVKHERRLGKARRRWWAIRLGVLLVGCGVVTTMTPSIKRNGWASVTPTTVLIALLPRLEDYAPEATETLRRRLFTGRAWAWQYSLFIDRKWSDATPFATVDLDVPERWPEGVPLACTVEYTIAPRAEWWMNGGFRVRVRPLFDREAGRIVLPDHATSRLHLAGFDDGSQSRLRERRRHDSVHLGTPAAGTHELEFEISVERRFMDRWKTIDRRREHATTTITGELANLIVPYDDPALTTLMRERTEFVLDNVALVVTRPDIASEPEADGLACPVIVELLHDGTPVTHFSTWWCPDEAPPPTSYHHIPAYLTGDDRPFGTTSYAGDRWRVRVHGDAATAIHHRDLAERFWNGSFEVPLTLIDTETELSYRSQN